ncbi:protoporphyrinogen oxidase [Bacillus luteolus]|uniref:Coproporphyrinogen III oxidase n=1 Tax=Litchfieldia luteola TaxID=682179 RepID=A0ABR9QE06_9BACI|nr:protoporphyrinogen oxidase [Cytobacillus luteolus]MBE4906722.1 protoporphyrinogen oxidase [Cytobacillus luteolus]MBP1940628.1 oxygen-dependent protoporphyrinogen oxidase [Cytobacillus luteolus]
MSEAKGRVIVIGGGITGLAATYYLQKESKEKGNTLDIKLIEASHRLGGKIQTATNDGGYVIEKGPDSFLARKLSASKLIKEVGLGDKLVYNSSGKSYVLVKGRLHPMPGGSIMGIPTQITPFITTGLFSPMGKMRAAADFVLPATQTEGDLSLGQFFRRRLGDEVVENLIEPLLSGIYAGDIDNLSLMSTFPQFYQVEQKHGSLIKGMRHATPPKPKTGTEGQEPKGMFLTISSGLQSLVEKIEEKLDSGSVIKGIRVEKIEKRHKGYLVHLNNGTVLDADSIILATPHQVTVDILQDYHFATPLKEMPSTSVATVALAFPEDAIKKDIDGTGFVVSRKNDYTITACTWTHKKWPHSTPKGKVLLRCYVGKSGDEAIVDQTDEEIIKVVLDDLTKTMDIDSQPEFTMVTRWKDSMPQYTVGHKERIENLKQHMRDELPGVFLAGSSYSGLGIPDCIDQGEEAVSHVLNFLNEHNKDLVGVN